MKRGNSGNALRVLQFGAAFARSPVSAPRWGFTAHKRTGANGRRESTSWRSLVRAQYRPPPRSKSGFGFAETCSRATAEELKPLGLEDECRQPLVGLRLMLFAPGPEDCFARCDRLELAVGSAHASSTLENREDLGIGGRVTHDPSVRSQTEDRRLHGGSRRERRCQWGDRHAFEKVLARRERFVGTKAQPFQQCPKLLHRERRRVEKTLVCALPSSAHSPVR
jgi:hypothetical protein